MKISAKVSMRSLEMPENIRDAVLAAAEKIADMARGLCPEDMGALKRSVAVRETADGAEISADADYAVDVEFGTPKSEPQPFLVPALMSGAKIAAKEIAEAIGGRYDRH